MATKKTPMRCLLRLDAAKNEDLFPKSVINDKNREWSRSIH